jgi:hypothetical protein
LKNFGCEERPITGCCCRMRLRRRPTQGQLRPHGRLTSGQAGAELVTVSIGPGGRAIALWASRLGAEALTGREVNDTGASFPNSSTTSPTQAHITVHSPSDAVHHTLIADLRLAYPTIQPLPNGEVLVVGARCAWTPSGVEPNAAIYGSDGTLRSARVVGDGVNQSRTTASGAIWIGSSMKGYSESSVGAAPDPSRSVAAAWSDSTTISRSHGPSRTTRSKARSTTAMR